MAPEPVLSVIFVTDAKRLLGAFTAAICLVSSAASAVEVYTGQPINEGHEYLVAGWNFNDVGDAPGSQYAVSHGTGLLATNWDASAWTDFTGTEENGFGGDVGGRDAALRNGSDPSNEGRYLEFQLSLTNFEKLSVTYATRRSASGFTDQQWWWSIDGETFVPHVTVTAPSSYGAMAIDFSEVTAVDNAIEVYLRLVLENAPTGASSTGNNRFDNFQFRAVASIGTAGPGEATLSNATVGSPYHGTDIFSPGASQSVEINLAGSNPTPITSASVSLPNGWDGLDARNVGLAGAGLSGAAVTVEEGVLTVFNGQVTESSTGTIRLKHLLTPSSEEIEDLGRLRFTVKTASSGGTLAKVGQQPVGYLIIPIRSIRPVDEEGVPWALNRKVAISGVATVSSGVFSVTDFSTYLQDDTGGVAVYHSPAGEIWTPVMEGNRYTAIGTLAQFRGLSRINLAGNDGLISLGSGEAPAPRASTVAQLLAAPEELEGTLVRIKRISKASASPAWPEPGMNATLLVTDDGEQNTLEVFMNRFTDVSLSPEPDYPLDLVGIFSQFSNSAGPFDTGYQLLPRASDDFREASEQETGFAQWQQEFFDETQQAEPATSGLDADPDGDGVVNLLEYALGANPWVDSQRFLPEVAREDGLIMIKFRRSKKADYDLIYEVEASADLMRWTTIWTSAEVPYAGGEAVIEEMVTDAVVDPAAGRRFLRLVVRHSIP